MDALWPGEGYPEAMELREALLWANDTLRDHGEQEGQVIVLDTEAVSAMIALVRAARTAVTPERDEVAIVCGSEMRIVSQVRHSTGTLQVVCKPTGALAEELAAPTTRNGTRKR